MLHNLLYRGASQEGPNYTHGIEDILSNSNYLSDHSIAAAAEQFQEEQETGEEQILSTWGMWISWMDAYEAMSSKYDTDILLIENGGDRGLLYYLEYLPDRGHKDDLFQDYGPSYALESSYDDYDPGDIELYTPVFDDEDDEIEYSVSVPSIEELEEELGHDEAETSEDDFEADPDDSADESEASISLETFALDKLTVENLELLLDSKQAD